MQFFYTLSFFTNCQWKNPSRDLMLDIQESKGEEYYYG